MADTKHTGEPAFPVEFLNRSGGNIVLEGQVIPHGGTATCLGMSLRDYFAAKALPAYFSDGAGHDNHDRSAKWAYDMADAMLKARTA